MAMYRYMALMWSRTDREAARAAKFLTAKLHEVSPHQWSLAWDGADLAIYHSGEHKGRMQTYRLQGERGAVLGQLFRNDYTSVVDDLDEFESRKCLETQGQRLIDEYWGRYVAFLNDPETGTRYVMRDPTGAFPCFHTPFRGVTIYFSDMQDAAYFDFLPFTVNWEFIKANMLLPTYQKTITGFNEVSEVLPAECVEVTLFERRSRFVWNPTEISQTDVIEDPEEAAELLKHTVKSTIGALAGCYARAILYLGGLDSSIALACMAQAPKRPEITCVTQFTKSPRGEERHYSRQVAEKYGVRLLEVELDYRKVDLDRLFTINKSPKPTGVLESLDLTDDVLEHAMQNNAQTFFSGVGGDNVFFQPPVNYGALDYVRCYGLFSSNGTRVALEAARHGRKSMFATLRDMARERIAPASCYTHVWDRVDQNRKMQLVNPEIVDGKRYERFLHPLLIPDNEDLKGKYLQILISALHYTGYYDCWDTGYYAERINAYFAQPIIEVCLRIPVWVLTYGGVDRGLARKAFWDDLPQGVARRYSKSTPAEFWRDLFKHNSNFLRDVLLDGEMVAKDILLGEKLEYALSNESQFVRLKHSEILGYAATEIWLKGWRDRPTTQPASLEVAM